MIGRKRLALLGRSIFESSEKAMKPGLTHLTTSIVMSGSYDPEKNLAATVGADFYTCSLSDEGGDEPFELEVWDPATVPTLQNLGIAYFRGTDCFGICVDCAQPFENQKDYLKAQYQQIMAAEREKPLEFILILTKADLRGQPGGIAEEDIDEIRNIFKEEGDVTSKIPATQVIWVSAKTGYNIIELKALLFKILTPELQARKAKEAEERRQAPKQKKAPVVASEAIAGIEKIFAKAIEAYTKAAQAGVTEVKEDAEPGRPTVSEEHKTGPQTALQLTNTSRAKFLACLHETQSTLENPSFLRKDLEEGKITADQARAIAEEFKTIADKVGCGTVKLEDLKPVNKALAPVLSKHTRTGLWAGRATGALLGCCIGGMLGMLCGPAAPFTVPALASVGTIVGAVLGAGVFGYLGGRLGSYLSMRKKPHSFYKAIQAAEQVNNQREAPKGMDILSGLGYFGLSKKSKSEL